MRKATAVVAGAFLLVSTLAMLDQASAQRRRARAEAAKWEFVKAKDLGFDGANTAEDDTDPENPKNDVVSVDTEPATDGNTLRVGVLSGNLDNRTQVADLDNRVELKYLFPDRDCAGGSPRFQLRIDEDGDGEIDGNAFGYIGDQPFGGACAQDVWTYEDMTNDVPKWDISQFGGGQSVTWEAMEAFFSNPEHSVRRAGFADDSASFASTASGCAYYDKITVGPLNLNDNSDTAGSDGGGGNGC